MSEFKFACPVCGQHMMCDASHGGQVMECPTCFQKIAAPQAPAADGKFILTGTKVTERKISTRGFDAAPVAVETEKKFPAGIVIGLIVAALAVGVALFLFRDKIFTHAAPSTPLKTVAATNAPPPPPKPVLVAPPASDTNWMLTLDEAVTPDGPVVGRLHGQDFIAERVSFQNGTLTLRAGTRGPVEFGVFINFSGVPPEALAGKVINVSADTEKAAPVSVRWQDASGAVQKGDYNVGYALRLEFGAVAKNRLAGKIYLCLPDVEKSYLMGKFIANINRPKPKPVTPPPAK